MINMPARFHPSRRACKAESGWLVFVKPPAFFDLPEVMVSLTDDQYRRYQLWQAKGGLIQVLLHDLSANEREMLMTGLGDKDFHRIAGADDDTTS